MKKLMVICVCSFFILVLASCDNVQDYANTVATTNIGTALPADSNDFNEEKSSEYLIKRIEDIEKEVASLKEALEVKKQIPENHGAIVNALDNLEDGDNFYLGMDWDGEFITAVYVKKPTFNFCEFFILFGYETGGVPILNSLIKPAYSSGDDGDNFDKYKIDKDQFEVQKLTTSKLKYDETSSMLIIMIDSNGNEYSQYIASLKFMMDR